MNAEIVTTKNAQGPLQPFGSELAAPVTRWEIEDMEALLFELVEDNPLAISALLKILSIEASDEIASAAVTRTKHPTLLVNLSFVNAHCHSDDEVKALLLHECLHVLLGHCVEDDALTPHRHIALDAAINALIHRQLGERYSSFMSRLYADVSGIARWLRPMRADEADAMMEGEKVAGEQLGNEMAVEGVVESDPDEASIEKAWQALYQGQITADELTALAYSLYPIFKIEFGGLLGDHEALEGGSELDQLPDALRKALEAVQQQWDWRGWDVREGKVSEQPGTGGHWTESQWSAESQARRTWRREVFGLLKRIVVPSSARALSVAETMVSPMPVLSTQDRRAFLKTLWSPILPSADWNLTGRRSVGQVQVYLDVSGSMTEILPALLSVLSSLHAYVSRPWYAFSTEVVPAKLEGGRLLAKSSGGTSLSCVLSHVEKTRPRVALVVTDGYVECVDDWEGRLRGSALWAVVSPEGSVSHLEAAGISCVQLPKAVS